MKDALNRRLPSLGARNSIDGIFGIIEAPSADVAWLANIDSRKLSQAVADMRAEQAAASRNASRADGVGQ